MKVRTLYFLALFSSMGLAAVVTGHRNVEKHASITIIAPDVHDQHNVTTDNPQLGSEILLHNLPDKQSLDDIQKLALKNTQLRLEAFVQKLKTFIFRGTFNVIGFEFEADEIRKELLYLGVLVEKAPSSEMLLSQLRHARHMFLVMADSVTDLKHYNLSTLPGHWWVYKVIELNVRLLAMQDSHGNLDHSIRGFINKIFGFWRNVNVWESKFQDLENVPEDLVKLYEKQSARAKKTIEALGIQMPENAVMCS